MLLQEPRGSFFLFPMHTLLSQLLEADKFSVYQPLHQPRTDLCLDYVDVPTLGASRGLCCAKLGGF